MFLQGSSLRESRSVSAAFASLGHRGGKGVFEAWESVESFNQVPIDPISPTLISADEIDLDPCVLRDNIAKKRISQEGQSVSAAKRIEMNAF